MLHSKPYLKLLAVIFLVLLTPSPARSQQQPKHQVDLIAGVELNYRDLHWNKLMELLINVTPAVKWRFGEGWQMAGQMIVPVYNDYGEYYKKVRLGMAVLSKETELGKSHMKISAGLFSQERYGLDIKYLLPISPAFALDAQLGLTGRWSVAAEWEGSLPDRITGWAGMRVWLNRWKVEGRLRAGRFIFADYGAIAEGYRHFKHCSAGIYGQYSDKGGASAGFKVIVMIPPYGRKDKTFRLRPASYFRLSHNIMADAYSIKMYDTDPEENEREGWAETATWGPYSLTR